jgi:hypothetical protein
MISDLGGRRAEFPLDKCGIFSGHEASDSSQHCPLVHFRSIVDTWIGCSVLLAQRLQTAHCTCRSLCLDFVESYGFAEFDLESHMVDRVIGLYPRPVLRYLPDQWSSGEFVTLERYAAEMAVEIGDLLIMSFEYGPYIFSIGCHSLSHA